MLGYIFNVAGLLPFHHCEAHEKDVYDGMHSTIPSNPWCRVIKPT